MQTGETSPMKASLCEERGARQEGVGYNPWPVRRLGDENTINTNTQESCVMCKTTANPQEATLSRRSGADGKVLVQENGQTRRNDQALMFADRKEKCLKGNGRW